ncbi:MAG: WecB/TagA/CpsF family glycosyltransferase [Acidobacteriaceae bacterium]|jgi:N-acetylglucosaminyldiphosphoundecaprenol N-acetyl-beta-D-mannosaminyltransferase
MIETDAAVAIREATASVKPVESRERSTRLPLPPRFVLGRVPVDRISMDYAAILLVEALLHRGEFPTLTVVGPNAQLVTLAQKDQLFAEAVQKADLSVPDGMSVVLASRLLGVPIPERVTGGDLMERMCAEAARYGFRVFFLGGLPGAAEMAAFNLRQRYPGLNICGTCCPPPGFENDPAELLWIEKTVEEARPDLLCVAFGAPKQEIWMQRHRDRLGVGVILPVGAAFDTQAGLQRRAPQWMQRNALEWLFRVIMEPRRLWRRYLIGNTQFIFLTLRQWAREKRAAWRERHTPVTHHQPAGD